MTDLKLEGEVVMSTLKKKEIQYTPLPSFFPEWRYIMKLRAGKTNNLLGMESLLCLLEITK